MQAVNSILEDNPLKKALAKITFIGVQEKPIISVVFFTDDFPLAEPARAHVHKGKNAIHLLSLFSAFQTLGKAFYANDELPLINYFQVSVTEMRNLFDAIKSVLLRPKSSSPYSVLSFTLLNQGITGFIGKEFIVDYKDAKDFYLQLLSGFAKQNDLARSKIEQQFHQVVP